MPSSSTQFQLTASANLRGHTAALAPNHHGNSPTWAMAWPMAILNPEADSAATLATGSEAKQRQLAEAGYKHVEGAPAPLVLELPHFS
ncbi:hypothetical protein PR003_g25439 [Phytophthora rubi]|uniref:Uncharacterized protein n=1 Tax=Phytophthora rubi TaxID=129364 RepID=A0A6A4CG94_9STRA|nr:hypothetical protein PR003_g25439 [Phytophthora rubi]